jgi:gentisate 1,2-dioxygenase
MHATAEEHTMTNVASVARSETRSAISDLDALYREAERLNVTPGWIKRDRPILWKQPKSSFLPMHWKYADVRGALEAAGELIDVSLAERRNLIMRNPITDNVFATTATLVCAYQMILPGEHAPTHRHSPHALRVIIDSHGSYSVVNGEKTPMETGDVVLTPGMCWHGHGHDGDEPAYWFDGLDVPLVQLLEPMFYEEHPDRHEKITSVVTESPFRFSRDSMARALDKAKADPDGRHGPRIELAAPDMPTIGLSMERLAAGGRTRRQRGTANRIFVAVEGAGETLVGDRCFQWRRGDTIAVPIWNWFEHRATADSLMFQMTDEPLMRFAKYYRSEMA